MYRHSKNFVRLYSKVNLLGTKPVNTFLLRRTYNTEYTEGTHHVPINPLDELLNHLESTKVSDPRTVSI